MSKVFKVRAPRLPEPILAERVAGDRARIVCFPEVGELVFGDVVTIVERDGKIPVIGKLVERPFPKKVTLRYWDKKDVEALAKTAASRAPRTSWPFHVEVEATKDRPGFISVFTPDGANVEDLLDEVSNNFRGISLEVVDLHDGEDEEE